MKPEIVVIASLTENNAIGKNGDLLYHISQDLRRFKALTMGYPVIMGRKTFESLPSGALPGRRNIVVTHNPDYCAKDIETAPSVDEAVRLCEGSEKCFIIGGESLYREAIGMADTLELTRIDASRADADTFFPVIGPEWRTVEVSDAATDPCSGAVYRFVTLTR